jgi:Domain of unknown function (DUF4349)/Putative zinc-finger
MNKPNHIVEPEELMAYLDGELPAEQAIDTAAHLESCRECQRLAADFKEVSQMMMGWEVESVEPELGGKLKAALGNQDRPRLRKSGVRRTWRSSLFSPRGLLWAGGLAVFVLIIFAVSTPHLMHAPSPPAVDSSAQWPVAKPQAGKSVTINGNRGLVPSATPAATGDDTYVSTRNYDARNKLEKAEGLLASDGKLEQSDAAGNDETRSSKPPANNGPMIVRTAELAVTTKDFERVRSNLDEILKRHHGYVGELNVNTPTGSARSLTATLRVPADGLDAVLADLKYLGRTEKESQTGEEVTQQYVDLQARLANAKHTEQRLADMLRERTGKLSDVLAVEMQIGRVRGEIEQMEAQRKNMKNQVDFATLNVTFTEDYKAELKVVPPSTSTQFRNAAVEGYRSLVDGFIALLLWLLSAGPTLLVWAAILFFPVRFAWRKLRPKFVSAIPKRSEGSL